MKWLTGVLIEKVIEYIVKNAKKWYAEYQRKKEIKRKTKEIIRTTSDPQERARKIDELVNGK